MPVQQFRNITRGIYAKSLQIMLLPIQIQPLN